LNWVSHTTTYLKGNAMGSLRLRLTIAWMIFVPCFPVAKAEEARRQKFLFVDNHAVAKGDGVHRVWNSAEKANGAQPVRFWQRDPQGNRVPLKAAIYASAIYDESRSIFQIWCRVFPGLQPGKALEGTEAHKFMRYGYCESRDGIDFDLISELKGLYSNGDYNIVVTLDPRATDPRHRYKAGYDGARPGLPNGACLAHSADGIEWTPYHEGKPVTGRAADFTNCLIWDEPAGLYRLFTRTDYGSGGGPGEVRGMRMMTNTDFENSPAAWTTVREWKLDREGTDEHKRRQIYTMTDWQYGGLHFGLFSIYEWPNDFSEGQTTDHVKRHERDVVNTYLATSRDAVNWDLAAIYTEQPLVKRGGDNAWDKDMVFPSSWIITRDQEHWIYYGGANERHGVAEIFQPKRDMAIGLAKLPLDRFAGLRATDKPGTIVTKPFKLTAPEIILNADARDGEISIELLDADGQPIAQLSGTNAAVLRNMNEMKWRANWNSPELKRRIGQTAQLRFRLQNATLYAVQIAEGTADKRS